MSLVALSAGVLNTWKRFAVPAATPVLLNLSMIAAAWSGAPWLKTQGVEPIYALGAGVMLGGLLQLGVQIPALLRLGMLPKFSLGLAGLRAAWGDADIVADQYPDCLAPADRQRELADLCRQADGVPDGFAGRSFGCGADAATGRLQGCQ
jgi:hypothetical protein